MISTNDIIGKVFQRYDTWNGSDWQFTIERIEFDETDGTIRVSGKGRDNWHDCIEEDRGFRFSGVRQMVDAYKTWGGITIKESECDHCAYQIKVSIFEANNK